MTVGKCVIYGSRRLVDLIPELCIRGDRANVVANLLFHCLGNGDVNEGNLNLFRSDYLNVLKTLYNNDDFSRNSREVVFSPFNIDVIHTVSPKIHSRQKLKFISSLEKSLESFSLYNTHLKDKIDVNNLHVNVGIYIFKIIKILRLEYKLREDGSSNTINSLFDDVLNLKLHNELSYLIDILTPEDHEINLVTPLVPGSYSLSTVLNRIVVMEYSLGLEMMFNIFSNRLKMQALNHLMTTDSNTGLFVYDWGLKELQHIKKRQLSNENVVENITISECGYDVFIDNIISLLYMVKYYEDIKGDCRNLTSVYCEKDLISIYNGKRSFIIDLYVKDELYNDILYKFLYNLWSCKDIIKVGYNILLNIAKLSCRFNRPFEKYKNFIDLSNKRIVKLEEGNECEGSIIYKSIGMGNSLFGLLQEYNVKLLGYDRSIRLSENRIRHLMNIVIGIYKIEGKLQDKKFHPMILCGYEEELEKK